MDFKTFWYTLLTVLVIALVVVTYKRINTDKERKYSVEIALLYVLYWIIETSKMFS